MPLNKQQLLQENNTNFPNNNAQFITPQLLREFNADMIDAMQLTQSMSEYAKLNEENTFTANQNIIGNLNVTGVISASILHVQTETASVIYSSGSNQFGDALNDTQILSGSVFIVGSGSLNGQRILTTADTGSFTFNTGSLVTTSSFNQFTQSANQRLTSLETNSASVNVSITNLNSTTASLNTSVTNLNQFTQSQQALNGTFATTGSNTFTGNQIIDRASKLYTNGVYWTDMTAGFNNLEIINQGGGNLDFASLNGGRMRVVNTPLVLTGSILSSNSDISTSANIYAANLTGSGIAINTGSFATTGSNTFIGQQNIQNFLHIEEQGNPLIYTQFSQDPLSNKLQVNQFGASGISFNTNVEMQELTASLQQGYVWAGGTGNISTLVATSSFGGGGSSITGSSLITASAAGSTITFTKGDNTQFSVTVATGSVTFAETASLATNALDIIVNVKNTTGATINKGTVVRIIGATGDNPLIGTASWTNDLNSANTLGFVVSNIANDGFGRVMTQGTLLSVNTDPALGYTAGQLVYLSSSGQFTNVKPDAPFHEVRLGQVLRAQQNNGSIYVLVQNGYELDELHDIDINTGSLANNDLLAWNSASQQWTNKTVNGVGATTTSSFNAYTSSTNGRLTNIESTTASLLIETQNLELFSASALVSISNLNASSASQQVSIDSLNSKTGSYATTGSNTFRADQTVSASILLTGNVEMNKDVNAGILYPMDGGKSVRVQKQVGINRLSWVDQSNDKLLYLDIDTKDFYVSGNFQASLQNGYAWVGQPDGRSGQVPTSSFGGSTTLPSGLLSSSVTNFTDYSASVDARILAITGSGGGAISIQNSGGILGNATSLLFTGAGVTATLSSTTASITIPGGGGSIDTGSFATTGSNVFVGNQTIQNADLRMSGSIVFPNGFAIGPNGAGQQSLIVAQTALTISSSVNSTWFATNSTMTASFITLNASNQNNINSGNNLFVNTVNQSVISSSFGNYNASNSNTFTAPTNNIRGVANIGDITGTGQGEVYLLGRSGSLVIGNSTATPTYASLSHITSSQINANTNLIFKLNSTTADTLVQGSGNIFQNPNAPTAGFKRYIGSSNIFNSAIPPQISGSMASLPSVTGNIGPGSITMRGPVSSSIWQIANNNIFGGVNIGANATLHAERLASQLIMSGNSIAGTLNIVANQATLTGSNVTFNNNNVNGAAQLFMSSSAVGMSNNNINDSGFSFINQYSSGSVGLGLVTANVNTISGNANQMIITGSQLISGFGPGFNQNLMAGQANILFANASQARVSGTNVYQGIFGTALIGNRLIVTGSSAANDLDSFGSTFVGRWNSVTGNSDLTAETVFAVGTGTSAARKTGFLIDSGSNTFVEGSLNVSGSTSLTGSLAMTGNLNLVGSVNVVSSSFSGSAITNITPVSSSQSPILNIVTMTTAEYALITPNSQTLYVLV